ncbi:MAG: hypothetical protein KDA77_14320 [Planctomycetaceae bacterium]|nr:hypothetical protein [Planctomycetaceae bacterium]
MSDSAQLHYAFLGAGAGAFFGGAGASSTFLGAAGLACESDDPQLEQGEAGQHFGAGAQHFGAGAQHFGAGAGQHTGAGLQQLTRTGLQQRTRSGLQQRTLTGLQQRSRTGLQQRSRTGLQQRTRSGLQQRFSKPASVSETLKDAEIKVSAAIIESVTVFRIMVYSSDSLIKVVPLPLKNKSLVHFSTMSLSLRT